MSKLTPLRTWLLWSALILGTASRAGLSFRDGIRPRPVSPTPSTSSATYASRASESPGLAVVRVKPDGNDGNDGSSWARAKRSVGAAIAALPSGGEVWVAAGAYPEPIQVPSGVLLYGGFGGYETRREQRDWSRHFSVLESGLPYRGTVVSIMAEGNRTGTVDGFVIRNGNIGIKCSQGSPLIAHNTITGNVNGGIVGGTATGSGSPIIADNVIAGNVSRYGAGISWTGGSPRILNNTIAGNTDNTDQGSGWGGALSLVGTHAYIANNIIAFNDSGIRAWSGTGVPPDAAIFRNNCIYGNARFDVKGLTDPAGSNGNIKADPRLADLPHGNLHIQPNSPCRDAGDNASALPGDRDIDDQPRIQGRRVDIGADESDGRQWLPGQVRVVRVRPGGSDANDGSSWARAKRTINGALDALGPGGAEVWVAAGTYSEAISLPPFVSLYGGFSGAISRLGQRGPEWRDPARNVTVLDAGRKAYVIAVTSGPAGTVDGFTLRNQSHGGYSELGMGAVICRNAAPVISHNTIISTVSSVYSYYGSPRVLSNDLRAPVTCSGGGAMIANNAIRGGITARQSQGLVVSDNVVTAGTAAVSTDLYTSGGIYLDDRCTATIRNNTIAGNPYGLRVGKTSTVTFVNNIIAFNEASMSVQSPSSTVTLRNNDFFGNATSVAGIPDPVGTDGNISADPKMVDQEHADFHIQPYSPCLDLGDDSVVPAGDLDIDGQPRIMGAAVDIGADESDGRVRPVLPPRVVRVRPDGSDANDGSSWERAKKTVQAAIDAIYESGGGEVWVAVGTYVERLTCGPFVHLYGGFAGTETAREQRNMGANASVLDGGGKGSVVNILCGFHNSTLDGFTVRGGKLPAGQGIIGAGIHCYAAVISNNTLTGNTSDDYGAALSSRGSALILGNRIVNNTGSGILCDTSFGIVAKNVIAGNSGYQGGGIAVFLGLPVIKDNLITGNSATLGGGIYVSGIGSPEWAPMASILNNTITGNTATQGGGILFDGFISLGQKPTPTVANNIVAFNSDGVFALTGEQYGYPHGTAPVFRNNDVFGNGTADYTGLTDPTGQAGNLRADPLFTDPAGGDFHLRPGSPCIDAGDDAAVSAGDTDLDGRPRIIGPRVDIGAFEAG